MSGDGAIGPSIFLEPQRTIGAQDLLRLGVKYYGFIRKRGQLERALQQIPLLKLIITKWRQKFVVISKGCLYIYNDEFAISPFQSVSLRGYDQVVREKSQDSDRMKSFRLYSKGQQGRKQFTFGSPSDDDRKKWMKSLKEEMLSANEAVEEDDESLPGGKIVDDEPEDEYTYLEKQVKVKIYPPVVPPTTSADKTKTNKSKNQRPVPEPESDSEDDYDKITEGQMTQIRSRAPLPEIPKPENVEMRPKPVPQPKPKPLLTRHISRNDFEFKSSDRNEVQNILSSKPPGTYLVRQSRQDNNEVLSVQTTEGMKEYRIFCKDGKFSIDHKQNFMTLELLLQHYSKAELPNRHDSLCRGYSCTDLNAVS